MTRAFRMLLIASVILFAIFAVPTNARAHTVSVEKTGERAPGQLLVKLKGKSLSGFAAEAGLVSKILARIGGSVLSVKHLHTDRSISVIRLSKTSVSDIDAAVETLKSDPHVEYAEPNYIVRALDDGVPNDPDFAKTWAMRNTGQSDPEGEIGVSGDDIDILPLWKEGYTGSRKTVVAVIDTGIDWNHPDLQANLYTNPGEIAGNGIDDDHNGFIDDVHGWNFVDDSPNSMDDENHGTHCAGIIGAVGNNGIGIAGINWNVSLMPIKFLAADESGTMDKAVEAINYATMMKVNVMSNSWGGGYFSQALHDAISKARDAGILFVTAAGNDARDLDQQPEYPASFDLDNVMAVAAIDNRDDLGLFSCYGQRTVDIAAPGVAIYSTVRDGGYATLSGTSMAAPHVAGVAALMISAYPGISYSEIRERIVRGSTPTSSLSGQVRSGGRLNAYNALHGSITSIGSLDKLQRIE